MQREMALLGDCKKPVTLAPEQLVNACKTGRDAIRLCVQLSGMSHEYISERLSIHKAQFSRIMSGRAHFPDEKRGDLMRLCGNYAPVQFDAMDMGLQLSVDSRAQRRAQLMAELASLDDQEAA